MSRSNLALSLILLFQIVVFGLVYAVCGGEDTAKVSRVVLLEDLDRDLVNEISMASGKDEEVTLARGERGWKLPEKADYPVDEEKLNRVLGKLLGLESSYVVSTGTEHHVELEVSPEKFQRRIVINGPAGERKLFIGSTGSGGFTNVRLGSQSKVYAVDDLKVWELGSRSTDWAKREVLELAPERVARLEIKRGDVDIRLERDYLDEWRIDGKPASKSEADAILKKATKIQLSDVVGRASDPDVKEKLSSGKEHITVTLALAAEPLPATKADSGTKEGGQAPETTPAGEELPAGEEGKGPAEEEKAPAPATEISDTFVVHLIQHSEKENVFYCYLENGSHVVKVDRWRVKKIVEAEAEKLSG